MSDVVKKPVLTQPVELTDAELDAVGAGHGGHGGHGPGMIGCPGQSERSPVFAEFRGLCFRTLPNEGNPTP